MGNSLGDYLIGLVIVGVVVLAGMVVRGVVLRGMLVRGMPSLFEGILRRYVRRLNVWFWLPLGMWLGVQHLALPGGVERVFFLLFIVVVTLYGVQVAIALLDYGLHVWLVEKRPEEERPTYESLKKVGLVVVRVLLWVLALVLILDNLGYNVTALITGLGIGGLVVGMALQGVLQDLFSAIAIYLDRPFVVGDFIVVGDKKGTVEHIGIKTTRIKSLTGEQIVIPNRTLTDTIIHNYRHMQERRVQFAFGVIYNTPLEKLRKIPEIVREVFAQMGDEVVWLERVHFKEFGDFSLNFEVVYWVRQPDYLLYMDCQERINLQLMERFREEGIEFAYPTQLVYLVHRGEEPVPSKVLRA